MSTFKETLIVDADGGGDFTTIWEAANHLSPPNGNGGIIIVENGTYNVNSSDEITSIPSNTTIIGMGNVVVNVNLKALSAFKCWGEINNVTLSGFKINVTVNENIYIGQVIDMRNVSNCRLENLYITTLNSQAGVDLSVGNNAIYLHSVTNCTVTKCTIKGDNAADEAFVNGMLLLYGSGHSVTLNHVSGCVGNLQIINSSNDVVYSNVLSRARGANILMGESKYAIIRGNQLNETKAMTGSHGIYPSGSEGLIICGNVVCENRKHGIKPRFAGVDVTDKYAECIAFS